MKISNPRRRLSPVESRGHLPTAWRCALRAIWKWLSIIVLVVGLMSGTLSLLRELLAIYEPGSVPAASLFWRCVWIAFIISSVTSWVSQYLRAEGLVKEVEEIRSGNRPDFRLEIHGALSLYKSDGDHTVVFIAMTITNAGADSAVRGYRVNYRSDSLEKEAQLLVLTDELVDIPVTAGGSFRMKGSDAINRRTDVPIVRGGYVAGRLPVLLPGDRTSEIHNGNAAITVTLYDYLEVKIIR